MVSVKHKGSFKKTDDFLKRLSRLDYKKIIEPLAQEGVRALAAATPSDSGITADSWGYEINISRSSISIKWTNSNINNGVSIAIILQYGHGTGTGGYVQGRDYINPAIQPIFDKIEERVRQEVIR